VNNTRLQHDAAMAMAKAILDVVASCLHPDCHRDAFDEFVAICKAGVESYDIQRERMQKRLRPGRN